MRASNIGNLSVPISMEIFNEDKIKTVFMDEIFQGNLFMPNFYGFEREKWKRHLSANSFRS